eukprot:RCo046552
MHGGMASFRLTTVGVAVVLTLSLALLQTSRRVVPRDGALRPSRPHPTPSQEPAKQPRVQVYGLPPILNKKQTVASPPQPSGATSLPASMRRYPQPWPPALIPPVLHQSLLQYAAWHRTATTALFGSAAAIAQLEEQIRNPTDVE